MSKIRNKISNILITIVLAMAGVFFALVFPQTNSSILLIVITIPLTYLSIWIVYYFSLYLLKIIKRSDVTKRTELLNTILLISIVSFILMFSNFVIEWNERALAIVSYLITALGYFYFSNEIEKTTPVVATIYSLLVVIIQTLLLSV